MGNEPKTSPAPGMPDGDRLDSWKEIAAYMRRDVRTVRRWEKSQGLPVRRHHHQQRASVTASKAELDRWWNNGRQRIEQQEQQLQTEAATARRRLIWLLPAAAATLLLAVIAWWLMAKRPVLSFAERQWILIADFENNTGDARFDRGLSEALTISVAQSRYANVFSRERQAEALKRMGRPDQRIIDATVGREICLRENIRALVACSITRAGEQYELSARLVDPQTGNTVGSYLARAAKEGGVLDALDQLATDIRKGLGESLRSVRQTRQPLPEVTTTSIDALTRYAQGREQWREGHFDQALTLYQSALDADPNFAMDHISMGMALLSTIYYEPEQARQHLEKALQLSGRTTERERSLIAAEYQGTLNHNKEAEQLYVAYLQMYPDDPDARYNLGRIRMLDGRFGEAIQDFQEALRIDPYRVTSHTGLATCYNFLRQWKEAIAQYQAAYDQQPDLFIGSNLNHEFGVALMGAGELDKARSIYSLALASPDARHRALRSLAMVDLYEGKYGAAAQRLQDALQAEPGKANILSRAREHIYLSIVRQGQGDNKGRIRELDQAFDELRAGPGPNTVFVARVGIGYIQAGAADKAAKMLDLAKSSADSQDANQLASERLLEGEIELAKGNATRAIELFQLAVVPSESALATEAQARAYRASGNAAQAIASYEKLISDTQWLGWEPQQSAIIARLQLAQLYSERGEKDKARSSLDQFMSQWKNADRDLPALQAATQLRQKLAQ